MNRRYSWKWYLVEILDGIAAAALLVMPAILIAIFLGLAIASVTHFFPRVDLFLKFAVGVAVASLFLWALTRFVK